MSWHQKDRNEVHRYLLATGSNTPQFTLHLSLSARSSYWL